MSSNNVGDAITIEVSRDNEAMWNDFAMSCGASFRAAYRAALPWQFDYHFPLRLRRVSCYLEHHGQRKKIAQAAVGFSLQRRVFAEGLMLLPEHKTLWTAVMKAVLDHFGAGAYHYGSPWSLEQPREQELRGIHGVAVISVLPITVFAIDFSCWSSWEEYSHAVSSNAKRNARRATNSGFVVCYNSGMMTLCAAHHLIKLSRQVCRRKNLKFSLINRILRFIARVVAMKGDHFVIVARRSQHVHAVFEGISFGENTYYVDSGSLGDNGGSSWLLTLDMIQRAYERSPNGHFITGFSRSNTEIVAREGMDFFRHQCRTYAEGTSEVTFRYHRHDRHQRAMRDRSNHDTPEG
jgi:hypothetical protein